MKSLRICLLILCAIMVTPQFACLSKGSSGQAQKLVEAKDYQGAIDIYQGIVDSKPGSADARQAQLEIGELYIKHMQNSEGGITAYQGVISSAPESEEAAEAHYRLGMHYYKDKQDYTSAQEQFDTIINNFPQLELSHNAQLMLAKSYEESKDYEKATEVFDNYANRNPKSERAAQALTNKARIQKEYMKDDAAAKRTYQSLVKKYGKVEGTTEEVNIASRELELMGATIPEPDDPASTQQGRALMRQDDRRERDRPRGGAERSPAMGGGGAPAAHSGFAVSPEEVMRAFGQIQTDDQGSYHDAMLMIANFNFGDENYQDAGALYFRAIELAKAENAKIDPYSYLRLSICYRKLGMHQRASEVLQEAVRKDRSVLEAVISTATNQYTNEEYEKAIETYHSILGINKNKDPELYWRLGLVYKKLGDVQKEVESLERAVAAKNDYEDALQSLAEALNYRAKDRKRAGWYQDLVDGKGGTYEAQMEIGNLCYKYENYTWSKTKYESAARAAERQKQQTESKAELRELDNQIVYAKVHAAMATYKTGQHDKAQEMIDALAAESPDHALVPYGKAELALLKGENDAAVVAFNESKEKDSTLDIPVLALGDYYLSQGYDDEAIKLWEGYLENNRYNQTVRRRLGEVKKGAEEEGKQ